jgi:pantoate--beta-alanine ligase
MSSRNTLLAPEEKEIAPKIYQTLKQSKALQLSIEETQKWVVDEINKVDGLEVEYYSIVDGSTLADINSWEDAASVVGCITVYCGKTPIRLIDHIRYK